MTPREVIAQALHQTDVAPKRLDPNYLVHEWPQLKDEAREYYYELADAVIDAARGR